MQLNVFTERLLKSDHSKFNARMRWMEQKEEEEEGYSGKKTSQMVSIDLFVH